MASNQRLDNQRKPGRLHKRTSRPYRRGYKIVPHPLWGDSWVAVSDPTGVTAGSPGAFTPTGAKLPANLAALQALGPLGQTTKWAITQRVVLADASEAYWSGTVWLVGRAPAVVGTDAHVTNPENYTIADIETWVDANPDQADELLAKEQARSTPRTTLVNWLQGFISHRDEGTTP